MEIAAISFRHYLAAAGYDEQQLLTELQRLHGGSMPSGWQSLKSSPTTRVAYQPVLQIYYKRFLPRNRYEPIKALLKGSRCTRFVNNSELLKQHGFNTYEVLYHCCRGNPQFAITRALQAVPFGDYLASYLAYPRSPQTIQWKRNLLTHIGREVQRLHSAGICHGDLRPNNLLIEMATAKPRLFFIDNERNQICRHLSIQQKTKNLIQLIMLKSEDLSTSDKLRLLLVYSGKAAARLSHREKGQIAKILRCAKQRLAAKTRAQLVNSHLPRQWLDRGLITPIAESDELR
jgi:tRNA A-37 threonylcarbamoyl transferase component Bud32